MNALAKMPDVERSIWEAVSGYFPWRFLDIFPVHKPGLTERARGTEALGGRRED